jgi:hypothetical protein
VNNLDQTSASQRYLSGLTWLDQTNKNRWLGLTRQKKPSQANPSQSSQASRSDFDTLSTEGHSLKKRTNILFFSKFDYKVQNHQEHIQFKQTEQVETQLY